MAVLLRHLGWMRDLRGQKRATKPAATETPTADAATDAPEPVGGGVHGSSSSASNDSSSSGGGGGGGGCFDIDENTVHTDSGGEDVVQGEEGSEHGHDEKKSSASSSSGSGSGNDSSSGGAGSSSSGDGSGDGSGAVESKGDDSGIHVGSNGESPQSKPTAGPSSGSEPVPGSGSAGESSSGMDDGAETPRRLFTLDEGSDDEDMDMDQGVSEQGVRLALLPDIRRYGRQQCPDTTSPITHHPSHPYRIRVL